MTTTTTPPFRAVREARGQTIRALAAQLGISYATGRRHDDAADPGLLARYALAAIAAGLQPVPAADPFADLAADPATATRDARRARGRFRAQAAVASPTGARDRRPIYARADLLWQEVEAAIGPLLGSEQAMIDTLAAGRPYSCWAARGPFGTVTFRRA